MLRTCLVALFVAGAVALPVVGAPPEERVVRVPYDLGPPGPFVSAQVPNPTEYEGGRDLRIGGTAVHVQPGETHVEVFLLDETSRKVPGRVMFIDANDQQITLEDFCFRIGRDIPPAAIEVSVHPSVILVPCTPTGLNYGPAVKGEMVLVFT